MNGLKTISYVEPSFESVQHSVYKKAEDGTPLCTELHSDVSLLLRINSMSMSSQVEAALLDSLKDVAPPELQEKIDNLQSGLSDFQLLDSDSYERYCQTQSERQDFYRSLAEQDKKAKADAKQARQKSAEAASRKAQEDEFRNRLKQLISD